MGRKRTSCFVALLGCVFGASLETGLGTAYSADAYVTKNGSPAPTGEPLAPYQTVEAGFAAAKRSPGCRVLIGPGKYYETFIANAPCVLSASQGTVTIGSSDYQAATTLDIITLNTHLAGDQWFMPSWKDKARAFDIAHFFGGANPRPDVVAFQEIWDEDLFFGGDGAAGILPMSGFPHGDHGTNTGGRGANSGLAIMSAHGLANFAQHSLYPFCSGADCLANKSWVQATIMNGDFGIGVFNIHTQADNAPNDPTAVAVRVGQIARLIGAISQYREAHPNHVVFAMGDYNVPGEGAEYRATLVSLLNNAGGRDADRNSPGFDTECSFIGCSGGGCGDQWTSSSTCNALARYFDGGSNERLDYIFYFPSRDGSVEVLPLEARVIRFTGRELTEDDLTTNQSSDHWSVYGRFKLIRR